MASLGQSDLIGSETLHKKIRMVSRYDDNWRSESTPSWYITIYYSEVTWVPWRLTSPANRLFCSKACSAYQPFKTLHCWPFAGVIHRSPTDPVHKSPQMWRYVKFRDVHAPGMSGTFSPPPRVIDPDMLHGTCVTHVPWCIPGSLTSSFLWSR